MKWVELKMIWVKIDKIKTMTGIREQDLEGEKHTMKCKVKKRVANLFKTKIDKEAQTKSKVKHLLEVLKTMKSPDISQHNI